MILNYIMIIIKLIIYIKNTHKAIKKIYKDNNELILRHLISNFILLKNFSIIKYIF